MQGMDLDNHISHLAILFLKLQKLLGGNSPRILFIEMEMKILIENSVNQSLKLELFVFL